MIRQSGANLSEHGQKINRMAQLNVEQVRQAIQQWASNPEAAIQQTRALADAGDPAATALVAYMLGPQTGRWAEGMPYARTAIEHGASFLAYVYGQNLIGQADAALRSEAEPFLRIALDEGWPADPFSAVQQAVQHGDPSLIERLLPQILEQRGSTTAQQRWKELFADASARNHEISEIAAVVRSERERVTAEMNADREAIAEQRRSVEQLAEQVGVLANKTAGGAIAEDYAKRAEQVERTSRWYTRASIVLATLIAAGATLVTLVAEGGDLIDDAASKAAIAIPLVALNLYLGRLAAQYRKEAVELRHIELQFNTANPFLSALDDERRKEALVQLAPKFFPGQALPGSGDKSDTSTDLNQIAAAALLERLRPSTSQPRQGPQE